MWGRTRRKPDPTRPMAAPGNPFLLSTWDRAQLMLWLAHFLYALAALLLFYALLFVLVHLPLFPLRQVEVKGTLRHVTYQQVSYIVAREFKGNFFTLDLARVAASFEKLPWVRTVSLRRRWPDRLEVILEEHEAVARLAAGGLVNGFGEVFQAASDEMLPIFDGPQASTRAMVEQYRQSLALLAPLGVEPVELSLNARGAWTLRLSDGVVLALGREHVNERLARFVASYDSTLARMPRPAVYVDLRYPNGFAARFAPSQS